jgi:hypothetical protein
MFELREDRGTESRPVIARPVAVAMSSASVSETKPTPSSVSSGSVVTKPANDRHDRSRRLELGRQWRGCLREWMQRAGGMTSNADLPQVSQIELNALRYQSINFGLSSTRGRKVTAGLALM